MTRRPPSSTLFPYTTLSRSLLLTQRPADRHAVDVAGRHPLSRLRAQVLVHAALHDPHEELTLRRVLAAPRDAAVEPAVGADRKSTRLNSSHANISYAVFCLK